MATDSRMGSELAGYRIEGVLGRGGMSVVYLAQHLRLDRRVALKVLAPDLAEDQRFRERFIRESRIAAGIEHPNIIPVYEAGEAGGVLYIAMRYVRGTDLKSLIRNEGKLAPARAMAILAQVGSALDAAHADHLIHRDVKPGNILIAPGTERSPEHVYLSDFGLTKRSSSDSGITATGQFVGTLDYAAPEQFEGKPLGPRTDTYSLGCVLYEVLTGEVPFRRDQDAAMMFAHLLSPPPTVTDANPDLPPGIDPVVARAMAKKPEDRYPTAGELVGDARSALGVASGEFAAPGGASPRRRPRWLLPAVAAALAAVVATVAVALSAGGGTPRPGPTSHPSTGPLAITTDAAARIDPKTKKLTTVIALPGAPEAVTSGGGAIWAVEPGNTVTRVDAQTGAVRTVGVGGAPTQIVSQPGEVWTWDDNNAILTSISTASGAAGTPFHVAVDLPSGGVAAGFGAVWVMGWQGPNIQQATQQGVFRVDPATGDIDGHVAFPVGDVAGAAVGEGSVWLVTGGIVHKIDPQTLKQVGTIQIGGASVSGAIPSITVDAGSVWVASAWDDTLYRIDPATDLIAARVHLPGIPTGVAVAGGKVWISLSEGTLCQVDVGTNKRLATIPVGGIPVGVAIGPDGSPWVAAQKT